MLCDGKPLVNRTLLGSATPTHRSCVALITWSCTHASVSNSSESVNTQWHRPNRRHRVVTHRLSAMAAHSMGSGPVRAITHRAVVSFQCRDEYGVPWSGTSVGGVCYGVERAS